MASFEDYAKKHEDNLQKEIDDADKQTADRKDADNQLPERFEGKSAAEIAASYTELEKRFSQQGNTLGEMRKALDDQILRTVEEKPEPKQPDPVEIDEFYEDPDGTIRKVAEDATNKRMQELEQQLAQNKIEANLARLRAKHPNWEADAATEKFQNWVDASGVRRRAAQTVRETIDFDLADDLITEFYADKQAADKAAESQKRESDLKNASLETSGAEHEAPVDTFSRTQLTQIRIAAKQGNQEADDWLKANRDAIAIAYEEGRITD